MRKAKIANRIIIPVKYRMPACAAIVVVFIIIWGGSITRAQQFEYLGVGFPSGGAIEINMSGDYLFSFGLFSYRLVEPDSFVFAGGYPFIAARLYDCAVGGNYAYFTDGPSYSYMAYDLHVLDISNPARPRQISTVNNLGAYGSMALSGDYVYIDDYPEGIIVIDISDPANPSLLVRNGGFPAGNLFSEGDYLYIAGLDGMVVVDIANPESLVYMGFFDTWTNPSHILPRWPLAYISEGHFDIFEGAVEIVDITDRSAPSLIGRYSHTGGFGLPAAVGSYLYVTVFEESGQDLLTLNISDPARPALAGFNDSIDVEGITFREGYLYGGGYHGLNIFDLADSVNPEPVYRYQPPAAIGRVSIYDSLAFLPAGESGLWILKITDPSTPQEIGHIQQNVGGARNLVLRDNKAFIAWLRNGLLIYDMSNPNNPILLGSCPMERPFDVAVIGQYAYVPEAWEGLIVLDVSNPHNPSPVDTLDTPSDETGIAVAGSYAYLIVGYPYTLWSIDLSSPSNPTLSGSCALPAEPGNLAISGHYAYVTCGEAGMQVVDIANPVAPTIIGSYDTAKRAMDVAISGDRAIVAYDSSGVLALDISDPAHPTLEAAFDTPSTACGVALFGEYVYVADYRSLLIFHFQGPQGVEDQPKIPSEFTLSHNYPNPFNPTTMISFSVPAGDMVKLEVFNILGQKVRTLINEYRSPGKYSIAWDGRNGDGKEVSSGVYFAKLSACENSASQKMILLK